MPDKHPISLRLGENIRSARKAQGLSQEKLAFRSGHDRTYIGHIERGSRNITVISLCRIAKALNSSPRTLLEGLDSVSV